MQQYFLLQGKGLQLPKGDKEVAAENNSSGIFFASELQRQLWVKSREKRMSSSIEKAFFNSNRKILQKIKWWGFDYLLFVLYEL